MSDDQTPGSKVSTKPTNGNTNEYTQPMIDKGQKYANKWQKWLFGIGLAVTLMIFVVFVWITIRKSDSVEASIDNAPVLQDSVLFKTLKLDRTVSENGQFYKSMILLESETIKRRYHSYNLLLRTQIFIKFLSFLTGMIISILGAMFILGKFREYPIEFGSSGGIAKDFKIQLQSTSPGIFLAFIGAVIMMTSILSKNEVEVHDAATYVPGDIALPEEDSTKAIDTSHKMIPPPP